MWTMRKAGRASWIEGGRAEEEEEEEEEEGGDSHAGGEIVSA